MDWTLQQILDNADELADRFEAFDPSEAEEIPVSEYLLQRAARGNSTSEAQLNEAVTAARQSGTSWDRIGEILGIPGPDAEQRYGGATEQLEPSAPGRA